MASQTPKVVAASATDSNCSAFLCEIGADVAEEASGVTEVRPDRRPIDPRFLGRWRISEMELWAADFIDLDVPGHFTFANDQSGEFQLSLLKRLDRAMVPG